MPCYDPRDAESKHDGQRAAAILCGILSADGASALDGIDWAKVGFGRAKAVEWYHDHLVMDASHSGMKPVIPDWVKSEMIQMETE